MSSSGERACQGPRPLGRESRGQGVLVTSMSDSSDNGRAYGLDEEQDGGLRKCVRAVVVICIRR